MARTPAITATEAEALVGVPFPADIRVDNSNRAALRRWAVARGYKSSIVYKLSNDQLAQLYRGDNIMDTTPSHVATTAPVNGYNGHNGSSDQDAAQSLAAAIQAIAGGAVNENRVRQIVAEAVAEIEPTVKRIEVQSPQGVHVVEGAQHEAFSTVLTVVGLGHAAMLVGPAGCGKTQISEQIAQALGLNHFITSTVFGTHELLGFVDGYGKYHRTPFREAFEHGGVWTADEVDAWDAAALLSANSAIANGYCTFPDSETPVKRHDNFRMIATANTYGAGADRLYVGRNELDAATLDRFATIDVDYDANLEESLCGGNTEWLERVRNVRAKVRENSIRAVVSTRAVVMGAQALAAGLDRTTVEQLYLFKGMSETDKKRIGE